MSDYGFRKRPLDLSGLPRDAPVPHPADEQKAVARGEALGFIDRGSGKTRRRPPPPPAASLYIKGPEEVIDWFIRYTESRGHRAYWQSLADLKEIVEKGAIASR
jgi:hypothetical protein